MPKMLCSRVGGFGSDVLCPQDNKTELQRYHLICSSDRPGEKHSSEPASSKPQTISHENQNTPQRSARLFHWIVQKERVSAPFKPSCVSKCPNYLSPGVQQTHRLHGTEQLLPTGSVLWAWTRSNSTPPTQRTMSSVQLLFFCLKLRLLHPPLALI